MDLYMRIIQNFRTFVASQNEEVQTIYNESVGNLDILNKRCELIADSGRNLFMRNGCIGSGQMEKNLILTVLLRLNFDS